MLLSGLLMLFARCGFDGGQGIQQRDPSKATASIIVRIESDIADAQASNDKARVTIEGMTPENLPHTKPVAIVHVQQTKDSLSKALTAAPEAKKQAESDTKEVESLKSQIVNLRAAQNDPNANKLIWLGVIVLGLAVAMQGFGIWYNKVAIRNISFIVGGLGLMLLLLSQFVRALASVPNWLTLLIGFGIIAGAVVTYWLIHRRVAPAVAAIRHPSLPTMPDPVSGVSPTHAAAPFPTGGAAAPLAGEATK